MKKKTVKEFEKLKMAIVYELLKKSKLTYFLELEEFSNIQIVDEIQNGTDIGHKAIFNLIALTHDFIQGNLNRPKNLNLPKNTIV